MNRIDSRPVSGYGACLRGNHHGLDQATAGNENNDRQSGLRRSPEPGTWIAAGAAMTEGGYFQSNDEGSRNDKHLGAIMKVGNLIG